MTFDLINTQGSFVPSLNTIDTEIKKLEQAKQKNFNIFITDMKSGYYVSFFQPYKIGSKIFSKYFKKKENLARGIPRGVSPISSIWMN